MPFKHCFNSMTSHQWEQSTRCGWHGRTYMPNYLRRGRLSINTTRWGEQFGYKRAKTHTHTNVSTYLPLRDNLPVASAIISKAPKSAFYGDPCLSGQFRGALVISLQPARNAPQQRRTRCLNGAEAVWAISARNGEPRGLFHISGEGFTAQIDTERRQ